jgi:hypothetical protein
MSLPASKSARKALLHWHISKSSSACCSECADSERSWTISPAEVEAKSYDLKAVNPYAKNDADTRPPESLLDVIESKDREVAQALEALRAGLRAL